MSITSRLTAPALAIAAALAAATPVSAQQKMSLTIAASHSENLPFVGLMSEHFTPAVDRRIAESGIDLRLEWNPSYGGVLYTFQNTLEAVEDNITDFGWVGTIWEASKMPLHQISFVTPFVVDDVRIVIGVMNDLHEGIPELRDEWTRHNQTFLGATGIGTYHLFTTFPINSLDDLRGKKINGAGMVGAWLNGTGAVPVDGGIPVFYENVKNRIVDGVLLTAQTAYSIKLHEVAPYVTRIGIGAQYVGGLSVNNRTWSKLPAEVQTIMREEGLEYSAKVGQRTVEQDEAALDKMAAEGATVTMMPEAVRQEWIGLLPDLAANWVANTGNSGGSAVAAQRVLDAYMGAMRDRGLTPARDWDR